MRKNKLLSLIKFGIPMLLSTICLMNENPSTIVEAAKGASHIGTFEGSTTFRTSSSNGINPGLFIEVMDDYGRLTQYESEEGVITISDTKEGAYVTQAKLLGKTKYKDIDSGEILDNWEEGRNLELISVENPELKTVGKNLFNDANIEQGTSLTCEGAKWEDIKLDNKTRVRMVKKIKIKPDTTYTISNNSSLRYSIKEFNSDGIGIKDQSWKMSPFTFTSNSQTNELVLMFKKEDDSDITVDEVQMANIQLEESDSSETYTPYQSNILTTNEEVELRGIGDIRDELDLMTGKVTERIGERLLDGSENWEVGKELVNSRVFYLTLSDIDGTGSIVTDSFESKYVYNVDEEGVYVFDDQNYNRSRIGLRILKDKLSDTYDLGSFKDYLSKNQIATQYMLKEVITGQVSLTNTYTFPPVKGQSVAVNGTVSTTIGSITVPTDALSFTLNPNLEAGQQFVAPEFSVSNDSHAPITLGVKSFVQTTDVLNDVSPDKYSSWEGLNKTESRDIALALIPKSSDNWISLTEKPYYTANTVNETIGQIKGDSSVEFSFEALHGQAFSEVLNPQYQLTFMFEF